MAPLGSNLDFPTWVKLQHTDGSAYLKSIRDGHHAGTPPACSRPNTLATRSELFTSRNEREANFPFIFRLLSHYFSTKRRSYGLSA